MPTVSKPRPSKAFSNAFERLYPGAISRLRRACWADEWTESARRLCRTTTYEPIASAAAPTPTASTNAIVRRRRKGIGARLARVEAVADPAHGVDQLRLFRIVLDLGPQPLDGRVHETRIAEVVVVPDELEQQLAREDLLRPARELEQEAELGRGKRDLLAATLDGESARIDFEAVDVDHPVLGLSDRAPEHG